MGAQSSKKSDVFEWIKKIISSTETHKQLQNAGNLIDLFAKRYNDIDLEFELSQHYLNHTEQLTYNG